MAAFSEGLFGCFFFFSGDFRNVREDEGAPSLAADDVGGRAVLRKEGDEALVDVDESYVVAAFGGGVSSSWLGDVDAGAGQDLRGGRHVR